MNTVLNWLEIDFQCKNDLGVNNINSDAVSITIEHPVDKQQDVANDKYVTQITTFLTFN